MWLCESISSLLNRYFSFDSVMFGNVLINTRWLRASTSPRFRGQFSRLSSKLTVTPYPLGSRGRDRWKVKKYCFHPSKCSNFKKQNLLSSFSNLSEIIWSWTSDHTIKCYSFRSCVFSSECTFSISSGLSKQFQWNASSTEIGRTST